MRFKKVLRGLWKRGKRVCSYAERQVHLKKKKGGGRGEVRG